MLFQFRQRLRGFLLVASCAVGGWAEIGSQTARAESLLNTFVMNINAGNASTINVFDPSGVGGLTQPIEFFTLTLFNAAAGTYSNPGATVPMHLVLNGPAAPAANGQVIAQLYYDGAASAFPSSTFFVDLHLDFVNETHNHGQFGDIEAPAPFTTVDRIVPINYSSPPTVDFITHTLAAAPNIDYVGIGSVSKKSAGPNGASYIDLVYNMSHLFRTVEPGTQIMQITITAQGSDQIQNIPEPSTLALAAIGLTAFVRSGFGRTRAAKRAFSPVA